MQNKKIQLNFSKISEYKDIVSILESKNNYGDNKMQKEKIIQSDADLRGKFVEKKITDLVKNDKKCIKIYQNCQHFCTPYIFF